MLESFKDITDRAGPPDWFDQHGVPRYGTFRPHKVTVYAKEVALFRIMCQDCHKNVSVTFVAATGFEALRRLESRWDELKENGELTEAYEAAQFLPSPEDLHYGDPPSNPHAHQLTCAAGATMNSIPLGVLQWWTRNPAGTWIRDANKEGLVSEDLPDD